MYRNPKMVELTMEFVRVDRSSAVPLYLQVERQLREQIARGALQPGDLLPPEHELCRQFGVSAITVKQGLKVLAADGLIVRERGRGTFVARPKLPAQDLSWLSSPAEGLASVGYRVAVQTTRFERRVPAPELSELLQMPDHEPLFFLERVYLDRSEVLALEQVYIPTSRCPGLDECLPGETSVYQLLEEQYGLLTEAEQFVEAIAAEESEARLFRLPPGSPLLRAERVVRLPDGQVVAFSKLLYRGDRFRFCVRLFRRKDQGR